MLSRGVSFFPDRCPLPPQGLVVTVLIFTDPWDKKNFFKNKMGVGKGLKQLPTFYFASEDTHKEICNHLYSLLSPMKSRFSLRNAGQTTPRPRTSIWGFCQDWSGTRTHRGEATR